VIIYQVNKEVSGLLLTVSASEFIDDHSEDVRGAVELGWVLSLHQKLVENSQSVDVVLFSLSANIDIGTYSSSVVLQDTVQPYQSVRSELTVECSAFVYDGEKNFQNSLNVFLVVKILSDLPWVSLDKVIEGRGRSSLEGVSLKSLDVVCGTVLQLLYSSVPWIGAIHEHRSVHVWSVDDFHSG